MRILRIVTRLNTGGPARHLTTLARALDADRYEQWLAGGREGAGEGSMRPFVEAQGVRLIPVPEMVGTSRMGPADVAAMTRIRRLIRDVRRYGGDPNLIGRQLTIGGQPRTVVGIMPDIRVALGATRMHILRTITGGAFVHLAIGGIFGTAIGLLVLQLRSVLLISVPDAGVVMPSTIFLTLALAGGTAGWLPARRALRIRPSEALSAD